MKAFDAYGNKLQENNLCLLVEDIWGADLDQEPFVRGICYAMEVAFSPHPYNSAWTQTLRRLHKPSIWNIIKEWFK